MTVPIYAFTDSWNAGGTTFTGIGLDITDTASASDSKLIDIMVGSVSKLAIRKDGAFTTPFLRSVAQVTPVGTNQATAAVVPITVDMVEIVQPASNLTGILLPPAKAGRALKLLFNINTGWTIYTYPASGEKFGTSNGTTTANHPAVIVSAGAVDLYCIVDGVWRYDTIYQGAQGTFGFSVLKTGSGSSISGGSTTLQNPTGNVNVNLIDTADYGLTSGVTIAGGGLAILSSNKLVFGATGGAINAQLVPSTTPDLSLKVGTTPLTVQRWLNVASAVNNFVMRNSATGNPVILEAEGADTDIDLKLTPKGTGVVQFGTHTALGAETVTGYVTIKTADGVTHKLAVVS